METKYNPVCWFELPVIDMARAMQFYQTVFGYTFGPRIQSHCEDTEMVFFPFRENKSGIMGSLTRSPFAKPSKEGVLIYFYSPSEDLAVELSRVEPAGGKLLMPKTFINPQAGHMGLFLDSEGNRVAILSRH
ncbi:MAG: VOC family protein [Bacteroidales bacterium]